MIDVFGIVEDLKRRSNLGSREVSFIELNRPAADGPTVALLAFVDGREEPFAFVKATADPAKSARLRREFGNLQRLEQHGDAEFRGTVPGPLYCDELGDLVVLAETARSGTRMKDLPPDTYFASRRFHDHLERAVRWLVDFNACLAPSDVGASVPPDAAAAIDAYRAAHSVSPALASLLDETLAELASAEFPSVPSHGDFCTANIVVPANEGLFVIDWEYPLGKTWPLVDLLYFACSTWCVPYRKGIAGLRDNYRRLFFESHGFSDRLRESTLRYADALGLNPDLLLPLSVIAWVSHANRKREELAGTPMDAAGHLPLIMFEEDACLNLEILAKNRTRYLLRSP